MTITEGELAFFEVIKNNCEVIFDVGVQIDTHYIESYPKGIFHLFEPNSGFAETLWNKVYDLNTLVYVNNFGLGKESGWIKYYPDSQSFIKRTVDFQSDEKKSIILQIKDFKEYITENNIENIDFLKIDTEGSEPDILFYNIEYIKNHIKFIQFEYASTWLDREEKFTIYDVYKTFSDKFNLLVLYNRAHPVFSEVANEMMIFTLEKDQLEAIEKYMHSSYGFDIAMVRKDMMN